MLQLPIYKWFLQLGVSEDDLLAINSKGVDQIDKEADEELLLVSTIKNQTVEKKGQRDFYEQIDYFDEQPRTPTGKLKIKKNNPFRNTTQGFSNFKSSALSRRSGNSVERDNSYTRERDPMRESTMYFLKQAFGNSNAPTDQSTDNFYTT
jgi:hypothetical protein